MVNAIDVNKENNNTASLNNFFSLASGNGQSPVGNRYFYASLNQVFAQKGDVNRGVFVKSMPKVKRAIFAFNHSKRSVCFPIAGLVRPDSLDIAFFLEGGNYVVYGRLSKIASYHKLWFRDIRIVPYLGEHPSLGIIESFITHFITHLVDEVEWDGDCDVVVREIKSPFSVLGRDHGDSPAGFLADVQL